MLVGSGILWYCTTTEKAQDRHYRCSEGGWKGHRDIVGAVAISRKTGLCGHTAQVPRETLRSARGRAT